MKKLLPLHATLALLLLAAPAAFAGDPTGSWHWTIMPPGAGPIECTLELKLQDGALTGTYSNRFGESTIEDASFEDEVVAFAVQREFQGNRFTIHYSGKLEGDTIIGNLLLPGFNGGEETKTDWKATREP